MNETPVSSFAAVIHGETAWRCSGNNPIAHEKYASWDILEASNRDRHHWYAIHRRTRLDANSLEPPEWEAVLVLLGVVRLLDGGIASFAMAACVNRHQPSEIPEER